MADQEPARIGLIVEAQADNLESLLALEDLACGLVDPDATEISKALHSKDVASMADFSEAALQANDCDSALVQAVDLSTVGKNQTQQLAVKAASRHEAMVLAEQGADLLIFDAENPTGLADASWWSEVMEPACALDFRGCEQIEASAIADFYVLNSEQAKQLL